MSFLGGDAHHNITLLIPNIKQMFFVYSTLSGGLFLDFPCLIFLNYSESSLILSVYSIYFLLHSDHFPTIIAGDVVKIPSIFCLFSYVSPSSSQVLSRYASTLILGLPIRFIIILAI